MSDEPAGQIVAMGGGGFSMEPDNPLLDEFVLSLVKKSQPRVCFIPTASGDSPNYIARFYRAFSGRCLPTDLALLETPGLPRRPARTRDLADFVSQQDVFYVGGGNTLHLLALWRAHGLDKLLREAWSAGAVLCGVSAGMICWFEASITDSFGGTEPLRDGLGFVRGSACPHFDAQAERRPVYHQAIQQGLPAGFAADDGAALHFVGTELLGAVSSRPGSRAYRVRREGDGVVEEPIATTYLGS